MAKVGEETSKSISIPMSAASEAMNELIESIQPEGLIRGGYEACIEKMENKEIKVGRILAIVRSFDHHVVGEEGKVSKQVMTRLEQILFQPKFIQEAKRRLEEKGQPDRYDLTEKNKPMSSDALLYF